MKAIQSSIDVALWILVDDVEQDFDHTRHTCGYLLAYVDAFLLAGPLHVRNAIEEEISRIWKIRVEGHVNQFDRKIQRRRWTFFRRSFDRIRSREDLRWVTKHLYDVY